MVDNLLNFLKSKPIAYPFDYPGAALEAQLKQYFSQQRMDLDREARQKQFTFGWSIDREEEALAILANTELLISTGRTALLAKWLQVQPDEVLDLIDAYCEFHTYLIEY